MGCIAKGVSRQLIQQDDQSQGGVGRFDPMIQFAARCSVVRIAAAIGEGAIKGDILGEPFLRSGVRPEIQHFRRGKAL